MVYNSLSQGGSSGKGTALKGGSDADLVVFLNIFKKYRDQELNRGEIIREIRKRLEEFVNKKQNSICVNFVPTKWSNPRVLSFKLRSYDHRDSIEFDVLPAFDALGVYVCLWDGAFFPAGMEGGGSGFWGQTPPTAVLVLMAPLFMIILQSFFH